MVVFHNLLPPAIFILALLLGHLSIAVNAVTVTNTVTNSRPVLGSSVFIECKVAGGNANHVSWFKGATLDFVAYNCDVDDNFKPRVTMDTCSNNIYRIKLSDIQLVDEGIWRCDADGVQAPQPVNLEVIVPPTAPVVTNPSPVKAGTSNVQFQCNADNADVTKPVKYSWTKNGKVVQSESESGVYSIPSVGIDDAGTYVCEASNEAGRTKSDGNVLVVHYPPTALTLESTSTTKTVGESETFTCRATGGVPVPVLKIFRQQGADKKQLREGNGPSLVYDHQMAREDNQAKFFCEATSAGIPNIMTSIAIDYNVMYPHTVNVVITGGKTDVFEHEMVSFVCNANNGNPSSIDRYQWVWQKPNGETQIVKDTQNGQLINGRTFEYVRIAYDQSGTYTCHVWNTGGESSDSETLNVLFPARLDPSKVKEMKDEKAGELGKESFFDLYVIANPVPSAFNWFKENKYIDPASPDYSISSPTALSSKLVIKSVKLSDYKNYSCRVTSSEFREKIFNFRLLQAGPPSTPLNPRVVNVTAVAATLEWRSGFTGGSPQRFYVQYKISSDNWEEKNEIPSGGIEDPGLDKLVYFKVPNLIPAKWYMFRVRAKNSHPGEHMSNYTNIVSEQTSEAAFTEITEVSSDGDRVTVKWRPIIGVFTSLKIRYCQSGTDRCALYTVPNPFGSNLEASFVVPTGITYLYYLVVEDTGDVVYTSPPSVMETKDKVQTANMGLIGGIIAGIIIIIIAVVIIVVLIMRRRKPSGKKKREAQELQNNMVNNHLMAQDGNVNMALHRTPTRSECDPTDVSHSYPSLNGSRVSLPVIGPVPKPDVVSHTPNLEGPYQNVPVGQGRPQSRPQSRAEENPYQNVQVNRNGQPLRGSVCNVPSQVGVDGIIYAPLTIHQNQGDHGAYSSHNNNRIRRSEESSPYASIDFSRKAPRVDIEHTV